MMIWIYSKASNVAENMHHIMYCIGFYIRKTYIDLVL